MNICLKGAVDEACLHTTTRQHLTFRLLLMMMMIFAYFFSENQYFLSIILSLFLILNNLLNWKHNYLISFQYCLWFYSFFFVYLDQNNVILFMISNTKMKIFTRSKLIILSQIMSTEYGLSSTRMTMMPMLMALNQAQ